MPIALAFAVLIGASLALFGAGGSIVTMPVLVYVLGLDAHRAAGTSLVVVGLVALAGALLQWRAANLRTGLVFGGAGMLGALPGAWLNHHVPAGGVLAGFAVTALAAAARLLRGAARERAQPLPDDSRRVVVIGVLVGTATGFFGVGGGFLVVPALVLLVGLPIGRAVATSLVVVALNSAAGLVAHAAYGGVEWRLGGTMTLAALGGAAVARPLAQRLTTRSLQRAFGGMLAGMAVAMLVQSVRELLA